ncbi:hypothetical protein SCA6_004336 [Theobroma cacao]
MKWSLRLFEVGFKIYKDCLPLHESSFRHAIEHNYQKGFKFNQELNKQQVRSLLSLFRPFMVSALGSLQPMQHQAVENQSRLPFLKDSCAQVLESQHVQQIGFQRYNCYRPLLDMSHVHPVMKPQVSLAPVDPNVTGMQLGYVQPVSEPQNILQSAPFQQQHYFGSSTNRGHSNPTTVTQAFLTSNGQLYLAEVQQPYVAGNPTQPVPDQYNRKLWLLEALFYTSEVCMSTLDENIENKQQLGTGNKHKLPSQGEGESVQQRSVIRYPGQLQLITDLQSEMMTTRVTIQLQASITTIDSSGKMLTSFADLFSSLSDLAVKLRRQFNWPYQYLTISYPLVGYTLM